MHPANKKPKKDEFVYEYLYLEDIPLEPKKKEDKKDEEVRYIEIQIL